MSKNSKSLGIKKTITLCLIIVMASYFLVSCGNSTDSEIIGRWEELTEEEFISTVIVTHYPDGTGTIYVEDNRVLDFLWSAKNGILTVIVEETDHRIDVPYSVEDDVATILHADGYKQIMHRID